ncbi:unnamed protein product [Linum tenue]|uniref:Uncharacterized protein n=1 Tax=Linum tenue TaxID=586396 RepID=A0AAV0P1I8_9ROSI|nr:unnamed protein product [Linum tenue]
MGFLAKILQDTLAGTMCITLKLQADGWLTGLPTGRCRILLYP